MVNNKIWRKWVEVSVQINSCKAILGQLLLCGKQLCACAIKTLAKESNSWTAAFCAKQNSCTASFVCKAKFLDSCFKCLVITKRSYVSLILK